MRTIPLCSLLPSHCYMRSKYSLYNGVMAYNSYFKESPTEPDTVEYLSIILKI